MTLFLKYRPQNFTDLVGQDLVIKTLQNAVKNGNPSHAYLFSGSRGTGKTSTVRIFAKALNCHYVEHGNPCGKCQICTDIAAGNIVDIVEIDAASHTGVDNIRNIIEKIGFAPTYAKRKVYIIDEVHMLSKGAFNALLKTLEEPPEHVYFLLATTELRKVPETIVSRCQTFIFQRFSIEQLVNRLQHICTEEEFTAERSALESIARKAEGGLRDAISLLEQIAAETESQITEASVRQSLGIAPTAMLENFWNAILTKNTEAGFQVLQHINEVGGDFRHFGHDFLGFLRDRLHMHLTNPEELQTILPTIEEIEKALARLKESPIVELPLEIAVIKLCSRETIFSAANADRSPTPPMMPKVSPTPVSTPKVETPPPPKPVEPPTTPKAATPTIPPVSQSTPTNAAIPTPSPTLTPVTKETLSDNAIRSKMKDIAECAELPISTKRTFLLSVPRVEGEKVTFLCNSEFNLKQLTPPSTKHAIESAVRKYFGPEVQIELTEQTATTMKPSSASYTSPSPTKNNSTPVTVQDFLSF